MFLGGFIFLENEKKHKVLEDCILGVHIYLGHFFKDSFLQNSPCLIAYAIKWYNKLQANMNWMFKINAKMYKVSNVRSA